MGSTSHTSTSSSSSASNSGAAGTTTSTSTTSTSSVGGGPGSTDQSFSIDDQFTTTTDPSGDLQFVNDSKPGSTEAALSDNDVFSGPEIWILPILVALVCACYCCWILLACWRRRPVLFFRIAAWIGWSMILGVLWP